MAEPRESRERRDGVLLYRLRKGADLLSEITRACTEANITCGAISAIGALVSGSLYYYDQEKREYQDYKIPDGCEIVSCTGNISERDGQTFVHAHVIASDHSGQCYGGHLMANTTEIFASELCIFPGASRQTVPVRGYDEATGLPLWQNI